MSRQIVVLAGSGRSGTTWLGSLLDSYEHVEYFYEITAFKDLDFDSPELTAIKYPLLHRFPRRPRLLRRMERRWVEAKAQREAENGRWRRTLRINQPVMFSKGAIHAHLFKIVTPLAFGLRAEELEQRFGDRLYIIHLLRNPFSQFASELRQHRQDPGRAKRIFRSRIESILHEERLEKYHQMAAEVRDAGWLEHMALLWWVSNEQMRERLAGRSHFLLYEDLCNDTYGNVEGIFSYLGWPLGRQTTEHIEKTTNVERSQSGEWSIQKNAAESMSRWRKELGREQYERINAVLEGCPLLGNWNEEDLALGK